MSDKAQGQFRKKMAHVADVMIRLIGPSVIPLLRVDDYHAYLVGTGTLLTIDQRLHIITCKHVANDGGAVFGFQNTEKLYRSAYEYIEADGALDCAVLPVQQEAWLDTIHGSEPIEFETLFAEKHDPVRGEVFFLQGYSQENSAAWDGIIDTKPTGFCTQINEKFISEDNFFYLNFEMSDSHFTRGTPRETRANTRKEQAYGLSGSLVWDTGMVRAEMTGRQWDPSYARVTGLAERWDMPNHQLVIRRIEFVRRWIWDVAK